VTRKISVPMTPDRAMSFLDQLRVLPIAWTDYPLIVGGVEHSLRYGISFWDGAIVAAAEALGSPILYSEDFNHGQEYGSVRALNPFGEA
jgi:predicted nucleic acid-binding protein